MARLRMTSTDGRSWSSPAWASSPRSAPARRTIGRSSPPANPASAASRRFPTEGLKTTIAGSVDFVPVEPFCSTELGERMAEMVDRGGDRRSRHRQQGRLSRPAVSRGCADRDRMAASRGVCSSVRRQRRGRIRRPPARQPPRAAFTPFTSAACSARSPSISPTTSAPRARRSRCRPLAHRARARSSSASRRSAAARRTRRSASAPTVRSIRSA